MNTFSRMKNYAREDVYSAIDRVNASTSVKHSLRDIRFNADNVRNKPTVTCTARIRSDNGEDKEIRWKYEQDSEGIWSDKSLEDLSEEIKASTITAAEDDEFEDISDDDGVEEALDDMQDSIEEIQDTVDEVQEDDISIDIDNNISNHYVAECDKCKGVFISAIAESDQQIEKVSGTCPICNKESDQYLKWIVRDTNE